MKRLSIFFLMCMMSFHAFCQNIVPPIGILIEWQAEPVNPTGSDIPLPKSPNTPPTASIDGHTLYIYDVTSPLALTVVDENQQVVYTAYVPAGNTTLVLPATLTGTFELQLYPGGDYYFAAEITL